MNTIFIPIEPVLDAFDAVRLESNTSPIPSLSTLYDTVPKKIYFSKYSTFSTTDRSSFVSSGISCSPTPRLYWLHIAIDIPSYQKAYIYVSSTINDTSLTILSTQNYLNDTDRISRDGLINLDDGEEVTFFSNNSFNTLWSGFRLDSLMKPLIAFYVARTKSWATTGSAVIFDQLLINVGSGWDKTSNRFIVPNNGTYYFCLSFGYEAGKTITFQLLLNGNIKLATVVTADTTIKDGVSIAAKSYMAKLKELDYVEINSLTDPSYSDEKNLQIAFGGFLYSPLGGTMVNELIFV